MQCRLLLSSLFGFFLVGCSSSELSGAYQNALRNGQIYTVTFGAGHTIDIVSPSNGGHFPGTYQVEGNIIHADVGFAKENFKIVDPRTLETSWQGEIVQLKKQQ
jgi:hypothetical protein